MKSLLMIFALCAVIYQNSPSFQGVVNQIGQQIQATESSAVTNVVTNAQSQLMSVLRLN